jgi:hypothetical protein
MTAPLSVAIVVRSGSVILLPLARELLHGNAEFFRPHAADDAVAFGI